MAHRPPLPSVRTLALAALVALAGAGVALECRWLLARRQRQEIAWANLRVADRVASARARLAERRWDEALALLEDALTEERAENRDDARRLLDEARAAQAEALFDAAVAAVARQDAAEALRLLAAYLAHPQARQAERGRALRDDLEHAVSDEWADRLLKRLPDEALDRLEREGTLAADDGLHEAGPRAIFRATLRRQVAHERNRRAAWREAERRAEERRAAERARRLALLRDTPAFREVSAFAARALDEARGRQDRARQEDEEYQQLFRQLGVNDEAEQAKVRADLRGDDDRKDVRAAVERQRVRAKRAFRSAPGTNPDDGALFDQLVDEELDNLLKMLAPS